MYQNAENAIRATGVSYAGEVSVGRAIAAAISRLDGASKNLSVVAEQARATNERLFGAEPELAAQLVRAEAPPSSCESEELSRAIDHLQSIISRVESQVDRFASRI